MKCGSSKQSLRPFEGKNTLIQRHFFIMKWTQTFFNSLMALLYLFSERRCVCSANSRADPRSCLFGQVSFSRAPSSVFLAESWLPAWLPSRLGGSPCWQASTLPGCLLAPEQGGPLWDLAQVLNVNTVEVELFGFDIWSLGQICFERLSSDASRALQCGQVDGPTQETNVSQGWYRPDMRKATCLQ